MERKLLINMKSNYPGIVSVKLGEISSSDLGGNIVESKLKNRYDLKSSHMIQWISEAKN